MTHSHFVRPLSLVLSAFALFTATACGPEGETPAASDEDVSARVRALGFSTETVEIDGDVIRVDSDIILYRTELLAGAYEPTTADADAWVEKGYIGGTKITSGVGNVKLAWGASGKTPTADIKNAFINAAGDYNSVSGSALRLSQNNTGASITINMMGSLWPLGTPCASTDVACAQWPANGNPGANIYIKGSGLTSACPNWTTSALANRVRHELGHAFGFHHPNDGASTLVAGTAKCTGTTATCPDNPGYSTVMKKTAVLTTSCTTSPTVLQTDDRASVAAVY